MGRYIVSDEPFDFFTYFFPPDSSCLLSWLQLLQRDDDVFVMSRHRASTSDSRRSQTLTAMQPVVDIYGGGGGGGYSGSGGARSGPGYLLQSGGGQKDGSCCSADGNDYAYVEDLVYPPAASTTTMTASGCGPGPPASSFGHLNHPQTVITSASAAGSRRDGMSSAGLRIMHHML